MSADATLDGPGLLVVLSGPSGVGKNTVVDKLVERSSWTRLVTATTRVPRAGEKDGVDYLFLSPEEFKRRGDVIFLVIDVKGGARVRELGIGACYIFVAPPDTDSLVLRLERRATEDTTGRDVRIERAKAEMDAAKTYDHVVVNRENDINSAVAEIEKIIERELAGR
jgi:guanylate kinase